MYDELEGREMFNKKTPLTNSLTYVFSCDRLFK